MAIGLGLGLGLGLAPYKGGGYLPEANALFARMTVPPSTARKALINTLIGSMINAGAWAEMDCLYVMAAHDAQAARLNWIADQDNLVPVNSPVFTVDRGYAGDGATSYLTTGFAPGNGKTLQNDHHFALWNRSNVAANVANAGSSLLSIGTRSASDSYVTRSAHSAASTVANANGQGFFALRRNSGGGYKRSRNAVPFADSSVSSTVFSGTSTIFIGGRNNGGLTTPSSDQIAELSVGGYFDDAALSAYYSSLNTYMTAIGAA